jgi:hypothetical protein
MNCLSCKFFEYTGETSPNEMVTVEFPDGTRGPLPGLKHGLCRRNAPAPKFSDPRNADMPVAEDHPKWPKVTEKDWCGEFVEATN